MQKILNVELAEEYGILMLCFPAHRTHRPQSLDILFFKSLKTSYNLLFTFWAKNKPGKRN